MNKQQIVIYKHVENSYLRTHSMIRISVCIKRIYVCIKRIYIYIYIYILKKRVNQYKSIYRPTRAERTLVRGVSVGTLQGQTITCVATGNCSAGRGQKKCPAGSLATFMYTVTEAEL